LGNKSREGKIIEGGKGDVAVPAATLKERTQKVHLQLRSLLKKCPAQEEGEDEGRN